MLGLVTPEVVSLISSIYLLFVIFTILSVQKLIMHYKYLQLQMPNLRQAPTQPSQPLPRDAQLSQQQAVPTLSGLPPLAQRTQPGLMPKVQQMPNVPQTSFRPNQFSGASQSPLQPQAQLPQQPNFPSGTVPGLSVGSTSLPVRPLIPVATASSGNLQMQSSSIQQPRPVGTADLGYNPQMGLSAPSHMPARPSTSDAVFQVPNFHSTFFTIFVIILESVSLLRVWKETLDFHVLVVYNWWEI